MRKGTLKVSGVNTMSPENASNKLDIPGHSRIHLNTERWRVPETWFSPGIAGVDSAGLGEVLQNILSRFDDAQKGRLVQVSCLSSHLAFVF